MPLGTAYSGRDWPEDGSRQNMPTRRPLKHPISFPIPRHNPEPISGRHSAEGISKSGAASARYLNPLDPHYLTTILSSSIPTSRPQVSCLFLSVSYHSKAWILERIRSSMTWVHDVHPRTRRPPPSTHQLYRASLPRPARHLWHSCRTMSWNRDTRQVMPIKGRTNGTVPITRTLTGLSSRTHDSLSQLT